jgi:hypothetical protein
MSYFDACYGKSRPHSAYAGYQTREYHPVDSQLDFIRSSPAHTIKNSAALTNMVQCSGITKQGRRCLKRVSEGHKYCYHHIAQDEQLLQMMSSLSLTTRSIAPGFIYVYTLDSSHSNVHVYDHEKKSYVPLNGKRNLMAKILNRKGASGAQKALLVKVGQTSKDPVKRLNEWKTKCGHPIYLMSPPVGSAARRSYSDNKQGWPTDQTRKTESGIHNELHALFGRGHVNCSGCKDNGKHMEWFYVPSEKLGIVFDTIDYWVRLYGGDKDKL